MFGSHLSISGGLHKALLSAEKLGMQTVQVFTKNQQRWLVPPLLQDAADTWLSHQKRLGFTATVSHASYLINLASPDDVLWEKSIALLQEELGRCALLHIPLLVIHPGAHMQSGEKAGLTRVAAALDRAHDALGEIPVITCLENTAAAGTCLGGPLEHLADIIAACQRPGRLGICLDTCHLFAAGHDFRGRRYAGFIKNVQKTVGLERVKALHLNDSKKPLGSRVDRHEHIGRGQIGIEGFRPLVRDPRWRNIPKILETPKGTDPSGLDLDAINLDVLAKLAW